MKPLLTLRHTSLWLLTLVIGLIGIFALVSVGDPFSASEHLLHSPSLQPLDGCYHLLGTDDLGRDVFSRLIFGARNSLAIGFFVVLTSLIIGSTLGLLASVYGGWLDWVINYFNDVIMSFPHIVFVILILTILGPGLITSMIAVTLVTITGFIRVAKTVANEEMHKEYILAARAAGSSRFKILRSELLPNCLSAILVQSTFAFSDAILTISVLGFLRIGVSPESVEWGSMLADAYQFMLPAPYLVIYPGLCIFLTVLTANLLGDHWLDKLRQ